MDELAGAFSDYVTDCPGREDASALGYGLNRDDEMTLLRRLPAAPPSALLTADAQQATVKAQRIISARHADPGEARDYQDTPR